MLTSLGFDVRNPPPCQFEREREISWRGWGMLRLEPTSSARWANRAVKLYEASLVPAGTNTPLQLYFLQPVFCRSPWRP